MGIMHWGMALSLRPEVEIALGMQDPLTISQISRGMQNDLKMILTTFLAGEELIFDYLRQDVKNYCRLYC